MSSYKDRPFVASLREIDSDIPKGMPCPHPSRRCKNSSSSWSQLSRRTQPPRLYSIERVVHDEWQRVATTKHGTGWSDRSNDNVHNRNFQGCKWHWWCFIVLVMNLEVKNPGTRSSVQKGPRTSTGFLYYVSGS
jgi:hypothetical protein